VATGVGVVVLETSTVGALSVARLVVDLPAVDLRRTGAAAAPVDTTTGFSETCFRAM